MPWITDHPRIQRIHRTIIGYICWLTIAHTHNNLHILHQFHVNHRSNKTAVRIKRKSCRKIVSYDGEFFYLAINWEQLCFFAIQTFVWQCEREKTYHIQKVLVFFGEKCRRDSHNIRGAIYHRSAQSNWHLCVLIEWSVRSGNGHKISHAKSGVG